MGMSLAGCSESPPEPADVQAQTSLQGMAASVDGGVLSETDSINAYLDSFYKPSDIQHTFNTIFGERIDCVDFYAQPSIRAMAARGLPVAPLTPPPIGPTLPTSSRPPGSFDNSLDENGSGRDCPDGTVPVHRPTFASVQEAGGVSAYRAAIASQPPPSGAPGETAQLDCYTYSSAGQSFDHAAGYQYVSHQGILTFSSVWNPFVENLGAEHSVSQLWALSGNCEYDTASGRSPPSDPCNSSDEVQSLELGWIVGNGKPQAPYLFTFITQHGYYSGNCWGGSGEGGCCNAGGVPSDCFVAVQHPAYSPGTQIGYSILGSSPYEFSFQVWNGTPQGYKAWFVYVNGDLIGYYPSTPTYAGSMQSGASYLQVGGEVYDSWPNGQHTETYMGSGYWNPNPNDGVPENGDWTAYHRHVSYIDTNETYHDASLSYINVENPSIPGVCGWDASNYYGLSTNWPAGPNQTQWGSFGTWNTYFYYGGPGE